MSTATLGTISPGPTAPTPYRFSVEAFHKMIDAGVFGDKRIELIEGQVFEKMTVNPAHDGSLTNVEELIRALLPGGWLLRSQKGVTLSNSQPLPDVCVVVGDRRSFMLSHPVPAQVGLIVEVADSSLAYDQAIKGPMYARDGIVEYWIVNIPDRQVEVYTQPSGPTASPAYAQCQVYATGSSVPLVLGGVTMGTILVDELLP